MRRIYRRFNPKNQEKTFKANLRITSPEVILITDDGTNIGIVATAKALQMAEAAELDLVEVNPTSKPPIVKIMDYGQFKYERDKKSQKQKAKQKKQDTKCIRLSVRIGEHDLGFRLEQAKEFLLRGDKLRVELILRGREKQHYDIARTVIIKFVEQIKQSEGLNIVVEEGLTSQGGKLSMLLINKKN